MKINCDAAIKRLCERFKLDEKYIRHLIEMTSEGDPNFSKFCPQLYFKHTKKQYTFEEEIGFATRWGICGILGLHARQMGYEKDLSGLWQPIININYACKFLAKLIARFGVEQGLGIYLYEWVPKGGRIEDNRNDNITSKSSGESSGGSRSLKDAA